jgi:hypothetical protein
LFVNSNRYDAAGPAGGTSVLGTSATTIMAVWLTKVSGMPSKVTVGVELPNVDPVIVN